MLVMGCLWPTVAILGTCLDFEQAYCGAKSGSQLLTPQCNNLVVSQWFLPPPPLPPASGGLLFSAMPVMHGVFIRH